MFDIHYREMNQEDTMLSAIHQSQKGQILLDSSSVCSYNIHIHRGKKWNVIVRGQEKTVGWGWRIRIECHGVSVGEYGEDLEKVDYGNNMAVLRVTELLS